MKSIDIKGIKREDFGKSANTQLRLSGFVPCELYGKDTNIHFSVFFSDFKGLVYTPDAHSVNLDIDGAKYSAMLQEVQYHPLSDDIRHADFLLIEEDKPVKVKLPIHLTGVSSGVKEGGKLIKKLRSLKVKGLVKHMPEAISVDITEMGMGQSVKVKDVLIENLEILNAPASPIATVEVPRGMKGATEDAAGAKAAPGKAAPAKAAPAKAAAPAAAKPAAKK